MVAELQWHETSGGRDGRSGSWAAQTGSAARFDWGPDGLHVLAPHADVVVVVDVLRFTSAVSAAIEVGCTVYPARWADDGAAQLAAHHGAVLAGRRELGEPSLSPAGLLALDGPIRLVLPSPNGAALSLMAREVGAAHVLAGCLRNATATARLARRLAGVHGVIAVIAAGERWHGTSGPLRPAVEDLLGAGAVLAALDPAAAVSAPCCSPEAAAARAAFVAARPRLYEAVAASASGCELLGRGWDDDVYAAAAFDVTDHAALLVDDAFVAA